MTGAAVVRPELAEAAEFHGLAWSFRWRKNALSYVRSPNDPPGSPSTAIADAWTPPSPMALPADICTRLIEYAQEHCRPIVQGMHIDGSPTLGPAKTAYVVAMEKLRHDAPDRNPPYSKLAAQNSAPLDPELLEAVTARLLAANQQWWTFDVDAVGMLIKKYEPGARHWPHIDWWPSKRELQSDKLAGSVPLNDPSEWEGGELWVRRPLGPDYDGVVMPKDLGTLVTFPCWALHEVTEVTAGERWVLLPNLYGPRLR